MNLEVVYWQTIGTLIISSTAVFWDLTKRRIPNWLTFPGMIIGITLHLVLNPGDRIAGLLGLAIGLAVFLLPFALGGLGAGDLKLMMSLGAFLGPLPTFIAALFGGVFGGIFSLVLILKRRSLPLFRSCLNSRFPLLCKPDPDVNPAGKTGNSKLFIPYALAIHCGLILLLLLKLIKLI